MNIIGIDTCGLKHSITILKDNDIVLEVISPEKHMQCEKLVWEIECAIREVGLQYSDIDMIATASGPGSFNGVRIGISAAYGISIATSSKLISVSTFEIMLYKKREQLCGPQTVCFMADDQTGFLQEFDLEMNCIGAPVQIRKSDLNQQVIQFDLNSYNEGCVSNATAAAMVARTKNRQENSVFYGKPPSIHS